MKITLLDLVLIILFFQLLTLLPFLLFQKTGKGIANRILGFFLLAKALCITNFLSFRLYEYTLEYFPHAFFFGSSFTILWGPTLYLYIRSLTEQNFRLSRSDVIHILPFLVHIVLLSIFFHIHSADAKRELLQHGGIIFLLTGGYYYKALHLYILGYTLAAFLRIRQFRNRLKDLLSSIDMIHLSWLNLILLGFMLKWGADVIFHFADKSSQLATVSLISSRVTLFLFINILIYQALRHPVLLLGENVQMKVRRSSLSADSLDTYQEKLLSYMEREKPYLNPELTLEELSGMVSIPQRSLTTVLNEGLNRNFYDFINSYRVKESARMLLENPTRYKTVLEVLYEAGFNNKASFNNAFKKHNGMTPTQFRKLQAS